MPLLKIETNKELDKAQINNLVQKTSMYVSELLNKPEKWVMVSFIQSTSMLFNADNTPCAFITLKSIGLDVDKSSDLSAGLCAFLEKEIGVDSERIYIDFQVLERKEFGWNGKVF